MRFSGAKWLSLLLLSAPLACANAEPGELSVLLEPEAVIIDGLAAGQGPGEVQDGWNVAFQRYVVSVGHVELRQGGNDADSDETLVAVDLTQLPSAGSPLFQFGSLAEGRYDFFYEVNQPSDEADASVGKKDLEAMRDAGATYSIQGTLRRENGLSCPPESLAEVPAGLSPEGEGPWGDPCYPAEEVTFELVAEAVSHFGPCEIDGVPGISIKAGTSATAAISIHGDHLFFNGFPEAGEGSVARLAQWLADCDLNLDATVTTEELEQISPADLAQFDERFKLGGSPLVPLDTMLTYVRAQLMTQGHFQGEGECALGGSQHAH